MNCNDLILDDVVALDFYLADKCSIPIPPNVALQSLRADGLSLPAPELSITLGQGNEIEMETPTVKATTARQAAGLTFSHDLQIPIYIGRDKAQEATSSFQGHNFHVMLTKADGSRYLIYSLPNTATCDVELAPSYQTTSTIKVKAQSMSAYIAIEE